MANEKDPFGTPDADGWYEWKGDDMIRPAGLVDVIFANEAEVYGRSAETWSWRRMICRSDIVKWRPAQ